MTTEPTDLNGRAVILGDPPVAWFDGKPHPWASGVDRDASPTIPGMTPHEHRRVRLTCENGWTLSIIWGSLTYSDNHEHPFGGDFKEAVETVEVGVMDREGDLADGDVIGYVPVKLIRGLIELVSMIPSRAKASDVVIELDHDTDTFNLDVTRASHSEFLELEAGDGSDLD